MVVISKEASPTLFLAIHLIIPASLVPLAECFNTAVTLFPSAVMTAPVKVVFPFVKVIVGAGFPLATHFTSLVSPFPTA